MIFAMPEKISGIRFSLKNINFVQRMNPMSKKLILLDWAVKKLSHSSRYRIIQIGFRNN